jgi:hypothetical protein
MATNPIKLVLPDLEAEVVGEALELYLRTRPVPIDHRYEYRYRAAQGVLDVIQHAPAAEEEEERLQPKRGRIED